MFDIDEWIKREAISPHGQIETQTRVEKIEGISPPKWALSARTRLA